MDRSAAPLSPTMRQHGGTASNGPNGCRIAARAERDDHAAIFGGSTAMAEHGGEKVVPPAPVIAALTANVASIIE
jgi:hypothetical protein